MSYVYWANGRNPNESRLPAPHPSILQRIDEALSELARVEREADKWRTMATLANNDMRVLLAAIVQRYGGNENDGSEGASHAEIRIPRELIVAANGALVEQYVDYDSDTYVVRVRQHAGPHR